MRFLDFFKHKRILPIVENKNKILRIFIYLVSVFLVALSYNVFFVTNELVMGGISGLAIVVKNVTGMNTSLFIILVTIILTIFSFILLGKKETKRNLICALIFPLMISITEPIANLIHISFNSYLFTCIIASLTYSIPLGILYKIGYSTGGGDIINQIVCKYAKTSVGQAGNYINLLIIFTAAFVLGIPKTIYAIFALLISNVIVDFIILGNSDSKLCIIKTKNIEYLESMLQKEYNVGYSLLNANGGVDKKKRKTIMCVVTSREYYRFKHLIYDLDKNVFFVTHDCYEVLGGTKKKLIKI